jgi:AraC family transcriptional regulator
MGERIQMQLAGKVRPLSFAGGPPALSSVGTSWAGPTLEQHRMQSVESVGESGPRNGECGLLVVIEGNIDVTLREGTRDVLYHATPGSVSFVSGERRAHVLRMHGHAQAVALQLSKNWFERLLIDNAPATMERAERFVPDATVLALTCAMRDEVARGASTGRLYADSLSIALLSYVLERVPPSSAKVRGSLPDEQQRRLRNYIRDNLGEDLSLSDLAALIGRSPRQFSTLFKQAFGQTPHRYLLEARLAEGARLLTRGGTDIAEVALRLGFCSQSHFATAFRRTYGVPPHRYMTEKRSITSGS